MRAVFLLAVFATACHVHFGSESRVWVTAERAFEIDPADLSHVSCTTGNGSVTVRGSDDDGRIVVRVKTRAGGEDRVDADAAMAAVEILHKRADGGVALGWRWREPYRRSWRADVSFDVTQPSAMPCTAETHNGDVRMRGMQAAVSAMTHNGSLWLQDCSGPLRGSTHNGDVETTTTAAQVTLVTHNGSVRAELVGEGPLAGEIRSHNGGIRLSVASGRSAHLVCNSNNGRVTCDLPLENVQRRRRSLVADLGSGEGRLVVETHNGSIRID